MNKIYFDLDKTLGFKNFEILSFDKTKNSPSAKVLRGKGSLFSAENFSFNDRISIDFSIKKDAIYEEGGLTEMQKIYKIYAMFRTKALVFINSVEIFNKIFPGVEQLNITRLSNIMSTFISSVNAGDDDGYRGSKEFKQLDEAANMICRYNLSDNYDDFRSRFFPRGEFTEQQYNEKINEFKNKATNSSLNSDFPFLVVLEKFSLRNITETSDGFAISLTFSVIEDIFNDRIQNYYIKKSKEFDTFYKQIQSEQNAYISISTDHSGWSDLRLNIRGIENERLKINKYDDPKGYHGNIRTEIIEKQITFSHRDISEFEIISHNNVAHIPIQGKSKTLKQYLGVGETNFSIKMFFKNDESSGTSSNFLSKIKNLQWLSELEQRELRITGKFGYLNALDFHGLEISDIHYSNDTETDGVLVTMIFKCSGYTYDKSLINSKGEYIDEFTLHKNQELTSDSEIYYKGMKHFMHNIKEIGLRDGREIDNLESIIIDNTGIKEYSLKDMCDSYYDGSISHARDFIKLLDKVSNIDEDSPNVVYSSLLNFMVRPTYDTDNTKGTDIVGIRPLMSYLSSYHFPGIVNDLYKPTTVGVGEHNDYLLRDYYMDEVRKKHKETYDKILVNMVHSMFPSYAYEQANYYFIEIIKVAYLDYLVDLIDNMTFILNETTYKNKVLRDFIREDLINSPQSASPEDPEIVLELIMKKSMELFRNRLDDHTFAAKVIDSFQINRRDKEYLIDVDERYSVDDLMRRITVEIDAVKNAMDNTFSLGSNQNKTKDASFDKIKDLLLIIKDARYIAFRDAISDPIDKNENIVGSSHYNVILKEFESVDIISLGILSIFTMNFGISASAFGTIASISAKAIVERGVTANSLLNSLPNDFDDSELVIKKEDIKKELQDTELNYLFGPNFTKEADALYRPITSNIGLTDLGNFLGCNSGETHKDNKIIYMEMLKALDFNTTKEDLKGDEYIKNQIMTEIYDLFVEKGKDFLEKKTSDLKVAIAPMEEGFREEDILTNEDKGKDEVVNAETLKKGKEENVDRVANEILSFSPKFMQIWDNFYDNANNPISAPGLSNTAVKASRYDSFVKFGDTLRSFQNLYSSNIYNTVPTYDVYVRRESAWMNANLMKETLRIEDFFGMDKLVDMSISYTESARAKVAIFSFIDQTEDMKDYGNAPGSNIAEDYSTGSEENFSQHKYTKTRRTLKLGDLISIRMGYNNDNLTVFNGTVQSIQGGKIKQVVCVSHAAELAHQTFDIRLRKGAWSLSGLTSAFKINFNASLTGLANSKTNYHNFNTHLIPSGLKTVSDTNTDYREPFIKNEACSSYNIVMASIAKSLDSLKHFNLDHVESNGLGEGIARSTAYYDSAWDNISEFFAPRGTKTISADYAMNINNVDRDITHYGIEYKEFGLPERNAVGNPKYIPTSFGRDFIDVGGKIYHIRGSAYVDPNYKTVGFKTAEYRGEDVTLHKVLTDAENRAPGAYWDVFENGFNSTLFFGRGNYNIKKRDYINEKKYFSYEALGFLYAYEPEISEVRVLDFFDKFLILNDSLISLNPNFARISSDKYTPSVIDFKADFQDLEIAQNKIIVTTGKNLISNKLMVNDEVYNTITIKYNSTIANKLKGFFNRATFKNRMTLYAFGPLEHNQDRIRETVITDDTIKTFEQATEMAQSRLQAEMENYYTGKIIITFDPVVRYRTEIILHDSVNQMYGTVLVKDFEHKFDSKGAYTIITPMLKITPNNLMEEISKKAFYSNLFRDESSTRSNFAHALTSADIYSTADGTGPSVKYTTFSDIIERELGQAPIIFGDVLVGMEDTGKDDNKSFTTKDMRDVGGTSLKMHPLSHRAEFLLPDLDIYKQQQITFWQKSVNFINNLSLSLSALMLNDKKILNTYEQNAGQIFAGMYVGKTGRVLYPTAVALEALSKNSLLGISTNTNKYIFTEIKSMMFKNSYLRNSIISGIGYSKASTMTIGFFNAKAIDHTEEQRIKKIAKVISNFRVCSVIEISSVDPNTRDGDKGFAHDKSFAIKTVESILKEIKKLDNPNNDSNRYVWKHGSVELIRKGASVYSSPDSIMAYADEYGTYFYREPVNDNKRNAGTTELYIIGNGTITINFSSSSAHLPPGPIDGSHNSNLTAKQETIHIPWFDIEIIPSKLIGGNSKKARCYYFHNLYGTFRSTSSYYTPEGRYNGFAALLKEVNNKTPKSTEIFIFGDFNLGMFTKSASSDTHGHRKVIGEIIELTNKDSGSNAVNAFGFKNLISINSGTTLGHTGPKFSYDNILHRSYKLLFSGIKLEEFGVFRDMIEKDYKTTNLTVSDHFPVYVTVGY